MPTDVTTTNLLCLDHTYSTTRLVTCETPIIENLPDTKYEAMLYLPLGEGRKGEGGLRIQKYFKKSLPDKPLITVITVVFNGAKHLEETILSVINQTYDNVEYIIIDGGSTDGTLDIIKQYEGQIDYWVSEKDKGISDAFNKGISLATGNVIGIINADDWYQLDAIQMVAARYIAQKKNYIIFHGELYYHNAVDRTSYKVVPDISRIWDKMSIFHPTIFVASSVYQQVGGFSNEYRYAMDCEFVHRCLVNNVTFVGINAVISNMRLFGVSDIQYLAGLKEFRRSSIFYGHNMHRAYFYYFDMLIRKRLLKSKYGKLIQRIKRALFT